MIERVETVAYGRPATIALTRAIEQAQAGRALAPVTVIVPSNVAGLTARRLLGAGFDDRPGGVANVSFVTPFRLVELLGTDLLLDRRPLTNPVLGAAVRAALRDDPGRFAAVAGHHATETAVAGLYAELSNVRAATLDRLAAEGGESARSAVRMHRAISAHLEGFHDEADVARAVAERADLTTAVASLGHVIWYLPAPSTTPLVGAVGAVLAAGPSSVIVALTGDDDADAAVQAACRAAGVEVPAADLRPPVASRIVSATDADEEVRAVVRSIVDLVERGTPLDRVGVFFPTPDPYLAILQQQLDAAGIPANGPARRRLADSVAGRTLLAALALPAERWRRDRVLALVSGGPLRNGDEPVRPSAWETVSRSAGVVQDLPDWRRKLDSRRHTVETLIAELEPGVDQRRIDRARRELGDIDALDAYVERLADGVAAIEAATSWTDKSAAAADLLVQLLGPGHRHGHWPDAEQSAFERVEDALTRLATLDELEPRPTHEVFLRALVAELDVALGRRGRFGEGVTYGPLASAVGHDLDAVFLVGCIEGLCPATRHEDGMLPDTARARTGGELELRAERLHEQHRSFLAALAAAPDDARTLSFPRGDLRANREPLASRWLLDSAAALGDGTPVYATDVAALGAPLIDVVPSFATGTLTAPVHASLVDRDLAVLARAAATGAIDDHPVTRLVARGLAAQRARRSTLLTEWDGNVAGQPIPSTADRPLSASRLEAWATCGFRYFLAHVLGLADRDDPEQVVDLNPLDRGSGVHEVLERFIGEAIAAGPPEPDEPWTAEHHARIRVIAEEVFADYEVRGRTGRPLRWRLTRADLLALIDEFLGADDAHRAATRSRPERVELPFGFGDQPPVTIALADGRVLRFRGYADRVDRTDDGRLLVSDYKTGKGKGYRGIDAGDPVHGGGTLQLGLYSEAARQLLGGDEVAAHYWMVESLVGHPRYGYEWTEERRSRFVSVLTAIADGIEGGIFPMVPGEWDGWRNTHDACTYCDFDAVCPRDRGEQSETKLAAPELRRRDALLWEVVE